MMSFEKFNNEENKDNVQVQKIYHFLFTCMLFLHSWDQIIFVICVHFQFNTSIQTFAHILKFYLEEQLIN